MKPSSMLELIRNRRVVRRYDPDKSVDPQALERILEAAIWAPLSIYHPQGWKFIALQRAERDRAVEIIIQDHTILKYIRHMYEHARIGHDETWSRQAEHFGKTLGEAPVIVVCLVENDRHAARLAHNIDAAWCAAQNMMLQAEAEGLGTGVVSMGSERTQRELIGHLGYDAEEWRLAYLMNLGSAVEYPAPIERRKEGVVELHG